MDLQSIADSLFSNTLDSLDYFKPELTLCVTIVAMLVAKVLPLANRIPPIAIALAGAIVALWYALPQQGAASWATIERTELFTGMLVYDGVTAFMRVFLMAFAVLFIILTRLTGLADPDEGQDLYCLLFGATIGMCIMASANHLMSIFLGVEMASVPSYVLAGIVKGRRRSSEAALKYAVYGAGAAGVMLYGLSLLAGVLGSAHLPTMAAQLAELHIPDKLAAGEQPLTVMVLALGGLMLGVGLAFKLSAVPFHFWCPDVFGGASAEVNGFLSVASKAAALALLVRVGLGLGYLTPTAESTPNDQVAVADAASESRPAVRFASSSLDADGGVRLTAAQSDAPGEGSGTDVSSRPDSPLSPVQRFFVLVVAVAAVVTCTFGNLTAYGQTNIKRMLAYSTIAHAGYMMMPVAAAVALVMAGNLDGASRAVGALLLYATLYLFMNLGAFAIVAFLRNAMQSEEIADYAGLIRSAPLVAVAMTAIMFSLLGLPPLAGFWGKLGAFQALADAGGPLMIFVLVVGGLNTALSLVYYVRVAKTMCIDSPPDTSRPVELGMLPTSYIAAVALPVVVLGVFPDTAWQWAEYAAAGLFG